MPGDFIGLILLGIFGIIGALCSVWLEPKGKSNSKYVPNGKTFYEEQTGNKLPNHLNIFHVDYTG